MSTIKKPKKSKKKEAKEKQKKSRESKENKTKEKKTKAQAQKRDKRREKFEKLKEHWIKNANWLKKILMEFAREHYVVTSVAVISFLFLFTLKLAVDVIDDRHPSNHPNVTDKVTLSIKIKNGPSGNLVFGLYGKDCPLTVKNFIMLVNHDNGYGYEDSRIFTIIHHRMIIGGDIVNNDGTGGKSALDQDFEGENLKLTHKIRGTLGMMNLKNNEDGKRSSQFYITLGDCSQFNGQMVVFGHLLEGLDYLSMLERVPVDEQMKPRMRVTIASTKHEVVK